MRRLAALLVVTFLATPTLLPPSLMALCAPSTLEQIIGWSQLIFVGTVSGHVRSGHIGAGPHDPPMTRYAFVHVRYIKAPDYQSQTADTLSLAQWGWWGEAVEGQPNFETGGRYVVFAVRDSSLLAGPAGAVHYSALGCVSHYRIAPTDTAGEARVADTLRAKVERVARRQSAPAR